MAGPDIEIQAPPREKRLHGLTDVATFRPNDRLAAAGSTVFQSRGCTFPSTEELRCYADPAPADKTSEGIEILNGIGAPVTVYGSVQCTIGPEPDELERANAILELGQDRALEDQLETWAAAGTALTAGADVKLAVARVESALDEQYIGLGVIAMSRFDASVASSSGVIEEDDDGKLKTKLGTPVLASSSFSIGTVYGLGSIGVDHSDVELRETMRLETNQHFALAEAVFAIAVDCEFRVKSAITA